MKRFVAKKGMPKVFIHKTMVLIKEIVLFLVDFVGKDAGDCVGQ